MHCNFDPMSAFGGKEGGGWLFGVKFLPVVICDQYTAVFCALTWHRFIVLYKCSHHSKNKLKSSLFAIFYLLLSNQSDQL